MRILYLPLLYLGQNNEQKYLEAAFRRAGHYVEVFDYLNTPDADEVFLSKVDELKPEVIHCQFQGTNALRPASLGKAKMICSPIITQWTGDVRNDPPYIPEYIEYGKYCDLNLVCNVTDIDTYINEGLKNVYYWQNAIAVPEQIGEPAGNARGIIFCGGNYERFNQSEERRNLIAAFRQEFGDLFQVYGSGWEPSQSLPWDEQTNSYARSYLILGHNNVGGKEWWFSDRQLIAMGSGRPHLAQWSTAIEDLFIEGVECCFYKTIGEAIDKAKWLLENPDAAARIGLRGQERVMREHSFDVRVKQYEYILEHYND